MRRRRHLHTRLDRLVPEPIGGGVLYIEDIESGAVRIEDLPTEGGGYILLPRPCQTAEEWLRETSAIRYPVQCIDDQDHEGQA